MGGRKPVVRIMTTKARACLLNLLGGVLGLVSLGACAAEPLRLNRSILALAPVDAEREALVVVEGVVTLYAPELQLCFIQDSSAGIYCFPAQWPAELHTGDRVRVRGKTGQGRYSPIIQHATFEVLGRGEPPRATPVAVEQLATGRHDSQWVSVEGVVHAQGLGHASLDIELASGNSRLKVMVMNPAEARALELVDARVRFSGVAGTSYNSKGQLTGFHLFVPGMSQIELLSPAPDPFRLPLTSSDDLLVYAKDGESDRRTRLKGVVAVNLPGVALFLQDKGGITRISLTDDRQLTPGQVVEVAGFPKIELPRPSLEQAIVRVLGQSAPPVPPLISLAGEMPNDTEGHYVRLRAEVLHSDWPRGADRRVMLNNSGSFVVALLPVDAKTPETERQAINLEPGTRVEVRGILTANQANRRMGAPMEIWCQGTDSLTILSRPSWWRSGRLVWLAAGPMLAIAAWGAMATWMNARLNRKTSSLIAKEHLLERRYCDLFESASDVLICLDLGGRLTTINQAGEMALGIRREHLGGARIQDLLHPGEKWPFRGEIDPLQPPAPTNVELTLKCGGGRTVSLDCRIRPIFEKAKAVGFQVIGRDISDRKLAEAALRESERNSRRLLEERERLGRDLHDGIIQSIYAIGLKLEASGHSLPDDPQGAKAQIRSLRQEMNGVIRQVRECISGMEALELAPAEFHKALKSLALSLGEPHSSNIRIEIDPQMEASLRPQEAIHLLRIAGEAMTNCVRHASASSMALSLTRQEGVIRLTIEDDGKGFDPRSEGQSGLGLRNMAARAQEMGARFDLFSRRGEGTRIVLDLDRNRQNQRV